jgi:hypothetical protein
MRTNVNRHALAAISGIAALIVFAGAYAADKGGAPASAGNPNGPFGLGIQLTVPLGEEQGRDLWPQAAEQLDELRQDLAAARLSIGRTVTTNESGEKKKGPSGGQGGQVSEASMPGGMSREAKADIDAALAQIAAIESKMMQMNMQFKQRHDSCMAAIQNTR